MTDLSILNVGEGDLRLSFDPERKQDVAHARKVVEELLRGGYTIVVPEDDGTYSVVEGFDAERDEYIVAASPSSKRAPRPPAPEEEGAEPPKRKRGRPPKRRVKAHGAGAKAIAPRSGG